MRTSLMRQPVSPIATMRLGSGLGRCRTCPLIEADVVPAGILGWHATRSPAGGGTRGDIAMRFPLANNAGQSDTVATTMRASTCPPSPNSTQPVESVCALRGKVADARVQAHATAPMNAILTRDAKV